MQTRWSAYAGVSVALAGGVVVKALAQRPNFYSAAVYLSQSSANLMILTNMVFVVACTLLLGLQKLLYGPLRPIEIEQLYEKAWFAVTETCLAMTIFRGEIGSWFMVMFFSLLAGKVWAWIGEGRVEILEQQPPRDPRLFHTRLALSLGLSVVFDLSMLEFVVKEVMRMPKPDMMVMFGFEFAVLSIISLSTAARYAINLVEIGIVRKQKTKRIEDIKRERREAAFRLVLDRASTTRSDNAHVVSGETAEPISTETPPLTAQAEDAARVAGQQPVDEAEVEVEGWEGKGRWVFYLDLATDFFKLVVYLSFFFILLAFYGLPIHILRDVFLTCRSFIKRISDFIKYRNATRDMNERYPDATAEDFGREDVCIICREEMRPYEPPANGQPINPVNERMRPKKLPCGHVLHFSCLRSWLERQQICPTCRTSVIPANQNGQATNEVGEAQGRPGQQQGAGGRGRGGVLRLGPLRIAVGAVRGNNLVGDLQQRLRDGEGEPAPVQENNDAPQQFGFGIRWEGMRRRERRNHNHRTVQDQLQSLERQILLDLSILSTSMAELQILRNMEAQLEFLRRRRQAAIGAQQVPPPLSRTNPASMTQTQLAGNNSARLTAGHPDLPAGLTLPDGWTMTPLAPANGPGQIPPSQNSAVGSTMPPVPNAPSGIPGRGPPTGSPAGVPWNWPRDLRQANDRTGQTTGQQRQDQTHQEDSATVLNNSIIVDPAEVRNLADTMAAIANPDTNPDRMQQESSQPEMQGGALGRNPTVPNNEPLANGTHDYRFHDLGNPSSRNNGSRDASSTTSAPFWGSQVSGSSLQPTTATTAARQTNDDSNPRTDSVINGSAEASMTQTEQPSTLHDSDTNTSSKDRNPTVEDLVEGPD